MSLDSKASIISVGKILEDKSKPLTERFRALFTLRNVGGRLAIDSISRCFDDHSALLKHELAYCLGQMQDPDAIPQLVKILKDNTQEPMVRHEAGKLGLFRPRVIIIMFGAIIESVLHLSFCKKRDFFMGILKKKDSTYVHSVSLYTS